LKAQKHFVVMSARATLKTQMRSNVKGNLHVTFISPKAMVNLDWASGFALKIV
jgi:hypothetical protein